ncbi:MAG: hypothetical protein KF691_13590 [Phycisphaeraceae bacterium]|nr:hypothetical protein [Phycisphaeraceae bacterium]
MIAVEPNEGRIRVFRASPWSLGWRHIRDRIFGVGMLIGGVSLPVLGVFMLTKPSQLSLPAQIIIALATIATGPGLIAVGYLFLLRGPGSQPFSVAIDTSTDCIRFENTWISNRWPSYLSPRASLECRFDEILAAENWPRSSGLAVLTTRGCILIPDWITDFHVLSECLRQVAQGPMPARQSERWYFFFGILCALMAVGVVVSGIVFGWW